MTKMSILAAANAAADEAVRAEASSARPATPISETDVAEMVGTLADKAREGKEGNAGASAFVFAEWEPRDRRAAEVAGAALERLRALGLSPTVENVKYGTREVPGRILVEYVDLAAGAQREETLRVHWVEDAREAWVNVGGEGADVRLTTGRSGDPIARFSTRALAVPVNDAAPFRLDFLVRAREREYEVGDFWSRSVAEVVTEVSQSIRPVSWTIPDLEAAALAAGLLVSFSYGLFEEGKLRQCAVVEFRRGERALKFAIEDVRLVTASDLAARALAGEWETLASAGPPLLPDRAPANVVAGSARDRAMGLTRFGEHVDSFKYVAPPGPPRIYPGDEAPVPDPVAGPQALTVPIAGEGFDPTRMTPVEALAHLPKLQAAAAEASAARTPTGSGATGAKVAKKTAPAGRTRKAASA